MYIVIRAGGYGTRLWPYSRKKQPKQFQVIFGDKTMLQHTYERCLSVTSKDHIFVSANIDHIYFVKQQIPDILDKHIIIEPESKNTGPAICLESVYVSQFMDSNEIIVSIPSDDYVCPNDSFKSMLVYARDFLQHHPNYIVSPASMPQGIDTGYSYIRQGHVLKNDHHMRLFQAKEWVEKPNESVCQTLIDSKEYVCHTGMYMWRLGHILHLYQTYQSRMYQICSDIIQGRVGMHEYASLDKISVEQAITSYTSDIACVVSNQMIWSDLGKWYNVFQILEKDAQKNVADKKHVLIDSKENIVFSKGKKVVTLYGVDQMVIIDTDDVLFICPKDKSSSISNVLDRLKQDGLDSKL